MIGHISMRFWREKRAAIKVRDIQQERMLIERAQLGDADAMNQLVFQIYDDLIHDQARRFHNSNASIPMEDYRSHFQLQMRNVIRRYSPEKGVQPNTFLINSLHNLGKTYTMDNKSVVGSSVSFYHDIPKVQTAQYRLREDFGREPTAEEIRAHLHKDTGKLLSVQRVENLMRIGAIQSSTASKVVAHGDDDDEGIEAGELIGTGKDPFEEVRRRDLQQMLRLAVDTMPEPVRTVYLHKFGLFGFPKLSEYQISLRLGLSSYKVKKALESANAVVKAAGDANGLSRLGNGDYTDVDDE